MGRKPKFRSPAGMRDILPKDQGYYQKIYDVVLNIANFYGFGRIDTPVLEETDLFSRGTGLTTDIVKKQMYSLRTKGGDYLTLRPEWTPSVIRAYIEHGMHSLPKPLKLWYFGPCYRYERPQTGRYRQFWQFGFEVLGEEGSVVDAQIIQIFYNILKELKLENLIVEINSIGDGQCRPYYKKLLSSYFKSREASLCADCKRRLRENVLRILDCKEEKCQPIKAEAPQILDHLCDDCRVHFKEVLEFLEEIEIPYSLNPYLVRGLDYYTRTVFEIFPGLSSDGYSDSSLARQKAGEERPEPVTESPKQASLVGGGRYDKLIKLLGGKDTPGCGAAAGVERIIELLKSEEIEIPKESETQIFFAQLGNLAKRKSLKLLEDFRKARMRVIESFGRDSLRAQLNRADRIGAKYTLILGQKEALEGTIIVRDMTSGRQEIVKLDKVVQKIKKRLKK